MNISKLRKLLERLPDNMEVILEFGAAGQKDAVYADVCTHENGGLHYSKEAMETSIKDGDGLNPEGWDELREPTFKIAA